MLICLALLPLLCAALIVLWIYLDDRARVKAYRAYREREDRRLAARTPAEIEAEGKLACILLAGDFFPQMEGHFRREK